MTAPYEKAKLAGYGVEFVEPPQTSSASGWDAHDPQGDQLESADKAGLWPTEAAAWEACGIHLANAQPAPSRDEPATYPPKADALAQHLETRRVVVLATEHLSLATCALLKATPLESWPVAGGPIPYGFYIYAHDAGGCTEAPDDLQAVCTWANKAGFDYVQFDHDADHVEGLTIYDHDPAPPMDPAHPDYLRSLIGQAADYVGRFADLNGEPEGGACRNLLALLEAEGYASHAKGATPAENVRRYDAQLNDWEISPNGDDYNNLHALALGGAYSPPHKGGR